MNDCSDPSPEPRGAPAAGDDTVLDWARRAGGPDLLAGGLQRYLRRRRRRRLSVAAAAGVMLLVAGAIWLPRRNARAAPAMSPAATIASASAAIVRPDQRALPDGSTVDLNTGAEIEVMFSPASRRVVLRRGEAHFAVAKDPQRPFVVIADGVEVRAVGTAFAVELGTSAVDVLVTEGFVAVNAPGNPPAAASDAPAAAGRAPAELDAGKRIVIDRDPLAAGQAAPRVSELSPADIQARLAWRVPRLKFAATPLAEVVGMFNAHGVAGRDPQLILQPGISADARVSGMLRADDVELLLRLLAAEFGISAERRPGVIVLHRP